MSTPDESCGCGQHEDPKKSQDAAQTATGESPRRQGGVAPPGNPQSDPAPTSGGTKPPAGKARRTCCG